VHLQAPLERWSAISGICLTIPFDQDRPLLVRRKGLGAGCDICTFFSGKRNAVEWKTNVYQTGLRILRVAGSLDLRMTMNPPF